MHVALRCQLKYNIRIQSLYKKHTFAESATRESAALFLHSFHVSSAYSCTTHFVVSRCLFYVILQSEHTKINRSQIIIVHKEGVIKQTHR